MPTLQSYRRFAAREAGRYVAGTVDASGNSTSTAVVAALKTSATPAPNSMFNDFWLYLPAANATDKVRRVASFAASTGTLTVDRVYSGASVPDGKAFELHGVARPFNDDLTETVTWTDIINDALKRIMLPWEITVTVVADATRHDLTTGNTWLTEVEQVRQVGYLSSTETRANVDPYRRRVAGYAEKLGNIVYLNHSPATFTATTTTLYVKTLRSAYDLVQAAGSGAFGAQSALALETDVAIPSVERVGYGALVNLAKRQGMNFAEETETRIKKQQKEWAEQFSLYSRREGGQLPELTFRPVVEMGSYRHWGGH